MQITINLTDPTATSIALDEVIFAQATTEINLSTIPSTETIADGTSLALLTPQGKVMAITQVASNVATLNTNTIECYEFVRDLPVEAARDAYIVLGSATKPIAIAPVQVARNVMTVTPPTEYAPIYPTAIELQEILAEMEAKRAEVEASYQANVTLVQGFEDKVLGGVAEVESAKTDALAEVETKANTSVGLVNQAKTNAVDEIGAVKDQAEGELGTLVTQAQTAKGEAETAKAKAETAQEGAEAAQEAAETALNNGCIYQVREVDSSAIQLAKTLTAYKHTPSADTTYTFTAPTEAEGKIIVFWLWVVMGNTAHQLTFPSTVTWLSDGAFAANTETLLAFMSTDGGATWQANIQWEKAVSA